ncbi:MAG TPA: PqqD family protein [Candidatus Baltobacteraceae bacterium]|jgi:hypothetical protein|nr:PqqD family protein [Candidatus Baltobacteraceae bacterium]
MTNLPARSNALEIEDTGTDVLVHDKASQKIHILNRTAGTVLLACDGNTSVLSVAQQLCPQEPARAQSDITAVIAEFGQLGLLSA